MGKVGGAGFGGPLHPLAQHRRTDSLEFYFLGGQDRICAGRDRVNMTFGAMQYAIVPADATHDTTNSKLWVPCTYLYESEEPAFGGTPYN